MVRQIGKSARRPNQELSSIRFAYGWPLAPLELSPLHPLHLGADIGFLRRCFELGGCRVDDSDSLGFCLNCVEPDPYDGPWVERRTGCGKDTGAGESGELLKRILSGPNIHRILLPARDQVDPCNGGGRRSKEEAGGTDGVLGLIERVSVAIAAERGEGTADCPGGK